MEPNAAPSEPEKPVSVVETEDLRVCYADPVVRQRMWEFLGGGSLAEATCEYVTGDNPVSSSRQPRPTPDLSMCLDHNLDIGRALWDRDSLIAYLDVEYVNFDYPAEAYQNPGRVFDLQKPLEAVIRTLLEGWGIRPLHVLSGRGHYYVWRIETKSPLFHALAQMGHEARSLVRVNARPHPPHGRSVSPAMGAAFAGLGLVMEFVAHRIQELAAPQCAIPIELTAVEAGPRFRDREMISIDISEYGDPLHTRTMRVPFSAYYKPSQQRWLIGEKALQGLPLILFIPLQGIEINEGLEIRRDPRRAAQFAREVCTSIPEQSEGTAALLASYQASSLAEFHRWFHAQEPHAPEEWPETYDRTPMEGSAVVRPEGIGAAQRCAPAPVEHAAHHAGVAGPRLASTAHRGAHLLEVRPGSRVGRAMAGMRSGHASGFLYAGLCRVIRHGRDDLVDFNCQSSQEEGTCPVANCPHNLELFRQSALARRHYDKLAHRPIHRLFLPTEHS
ncbi:MAG: hypothetical protein WDN28_01155 [Chthoniobacter sp.]